MGENGREKMEVSFSLYIQNVANNQIENEERDDTRGSLPHHRRNLVQEGPRP